MGKIRKNSSLLGEGQGKIGKNVFSKTKYGTVVRDLPSEHLIIPPGQLKQMDYMDFVSKTYSKLSEEEAGWWRQWASYPEVRNLYTKKGHLEGRNLFFAVNMKRIETGEPLILSKPDFGNAQMFDKIKIDIVSVNNKRDIILDIFPEIEENTKLIIRATEGVQDNILSIHASEYKKICILDSGFRSGSSIKEFYLSVHKTMPGKDKKIVFLVTSVNRDCGSSSNPKKISARQKQKPENVLIKRYVAYPENSKINRPPERLEKMRGKGEVKAT